ncbi:MAG: hypothetical protein R3362_05100 [Rhodothermales bacterium]|nr:hypothetical protein [Rhodothermales bacterium]
MPLTVLPMARLLAAFALLLAAWAPAAPTDEDVRVPAGGARATTAADLAPQRSLSGGFNESWGYVFQFDDGATAYLNLHRADLGTFMKNAVGAEFAISGFNGQTYRIIKQYDASNLTWRNGRLSVHPEIFFEGVPPQAHRVYFKRGKDGDQYEVDLRFSDIAPGMTWGDGVFAFGGEEVGLFVHVPYARVSGTITINGRAKRVSGTAYMDHIFQTAFPPRLVDFAFRYVSHGPEREVGYLLLPDARFEQQPVGFGLRQRGGRWQLLKPAQVQVVSSRAALGVAVPQQVDLAYDAGRTILNRRGDRIQFSAFEELGGLQRTVARQYVGGEVFGFRGQGTTNNRRPFAYDFIVVQ